jgi:hypothetical protein
MGLFHLVSASSDVSTVVESRCIFFFMRTAVALVVVSSLIGCGGLEPSNTDLGLRVEASVTPRLVSASDTAAVLHVRVTVINPTKRDIIIVTGGPPYRITGDPTESEGLSLSFRIASSTDPLNAGPSADWWGSSEDTVRAERGLYVTHDVPLKFWRAGGWPLEAGDYRVRGYYNGREGQAAPFTIAP